MGGKEQGGSRRGGFDGSGLGEEVHLAPVDSAPGVQSRDSQLAPRKAWRSGLAVPPGGSRDRFGDQLPIYLLQPGL